VAVAADGSIWVSDARRHALVRFDRAGNFVAQIGERGLERNQFFKPRGLAFDGQGRLCVLDWGNHRGQLLSGAGESLGSFGSRLFTKSFRAGGSR
jgi:hypothetical protein